MLCVCSFATRHMCHLPFGPRKRRDKPTGSLRKPSLRKPSHCGERPPEIEAILIDSMLLRQAERDALREAAGITWSCPVTDSSPNF